MNPAIAVDPFSLQLPFPPRNITPLAPIESMNHPMTGVENLGASQPSRCYEPAPRTKQRGNCKKVHAFCEAKRPCHRCVETGYKDSCSDPPHIRTPRTKPCGKCKKAHRRCEAKRPCHRCVKLGQKDSCSDPPHIHTLRTKPCGNCKKVHARCEAKRPCHRCVETGYKDSCSNIEHKRDNTPFSSGLQSFPPRIFTPLTPSASMNHPITVEKDPGVSPPSYRYNTASDIEHAVGQVANDESGLSDTSGLDTRAEDMLVVGDVVRSDNAVNGIEVAREIKVSRGNRKLRSCKDKNVDKDLFEIIHRTLTGAPEKPFSIWTLISSYPQKDCPRNTHGITNRNYLQMHKRRHSQGKFKCQYCQNSYQFQSSLQYHLGKCAAAKDTTFLTATSAPKQDQFDKDSSSNGNQHGVAFHGYQGDFHNRHQTDDITEQQIPIPLRDSLSDPSSNGHEVNGCNSSQIPPDSYNHYQTGDITEQQIAMCFTMNKELCARNYNNIAEQQIPIPLRDSLSNPSSNGHEANGCNSSQIPSDSYNHYQTSDITEQQIPIPLRDSLSDPSSSGHEAIGCSSSQTPSTDSYYHCQTGDITGQLPMCFTMNEESCARNYDNITEQQISMWPATNEESCVRSYEGDSYDFHNRCQTGAITEQQELLSLGSGCCAGLSTEGLGGNILQGSQPSRAAKKIILASSKIRADYMPEPTAVMHLGPERADQAINMAPLPANTQLEYEIFLAGGSWTYDLNTAASDDADDNNDGDHADDEDLAESGTGDEDLVKHYHQISSVPDIAATGPSIHPRSYERPRLSVYAPLYQYARLYFLRLPRTRSTYPFHEPVGSDDFLRQRQSR
ncbi:uncharacterized protein BDZ99DRAFT_548108 [Mytilinidion resinicola]|uniref:Zn(2)-C6 fungal-type domain-containing protein n=1 Tax=Mytilinidion resinicola TaxID=574789 RepID=A0A6A6Y3S7_9PEZI|nr:uncharacterized protein BDZ99DRAFT_548108 [Mytilinidion resinicola]KAF2802885.1 hypothetical protein BDZ99DRAFT_548108 [Mytilinidion resinicola]